jgi:hypothetical protein
LLLIGSPPVASSLSIRYDPTPMSKNKILSSGLLAIAFTAIGADRAWAQG